MDPITGGLAVVSGLTSLYEGYAKRKKDRKRRKRREKQIGATAESMYRRGAPAIQQSMAQAKSGLLGRAGAAGAGRASVTSSAVAGIETQVGVELEKLRAGVAQWKQQMLAGVPAESEMDIGGTLMGVANIFAGEKARSERAAERAEDRRFLERLYGGRKDKEEEEEEEEEWAPRSPSEFASGLHRMFD